MQLLYILAEGDVPPGAYMVGMARGQGPVGGLGGLEPRGPPPVAEGLDPAAGSDGAAAPPRPGGAGGRLKS